MLEPSFADLGRRHPELETHLREHFKKTGQEVFPQCKERFRNSIRTYNTYVHYCTLLVCANHALRLKDLATYSQIALQYLRIFHSNFQEINGISDKFAIASLRQFLEVVKAAGSPGQSLSSQNFFCRLFPLINYVRYALLSGLPNSFYFKVCLALLKQSLQAFRDRPELRCAVNTLLVGAEKRAPKLLVCSHFVLAHRCFEQRALNANLKTFQRFQCKKTHEDYLDSTEHFFCPKFIQKCRSARG